MNSSQVSLRLRKFVPRKIGRKKEEKEFATGS